jgi:hypothetical protein
MAKGSKVVAGTAAAKWARHLKELEKSGLSVRKFAAREGLKAGSLSFWRWKLDRAGRSTETQRIAPLKFVELTGEFPATAPAAMEFEVVLGSGRIVRVPGGFDACELARLVMALEGVRS